MGKVFQAETSQHYKLILWILCTAKHPVVESIWLKLEKEWPNLSGAEGRDEYCFTKTPNYSI